jgi:hypothetical protein
MVSFAEAERFVSADRAGQQTGSRRKHCVAAFPHELPITVQFNAAGHRQRRCATNSARNARSSRRAKL